MQRPLIVIHGWSETSHALKPLCNLLQQALAQPVQSLYVGDYLSMHDDISFCDLSAAMMSAWQTSGLPLTQYSADVVVHSTAGIIVRQWLLDHFTPDTAPIKHLVMLAPANFGSYLAHKGRSFFARMLGGLNHQTPGQMGGTLLKSMELGSPYLWQLAQRDCFSKDSFFAANKILCTVLIGDTGYQGTHAIVNELGSDGTIRLANANLNSQYVVVDYNKDLMQPDYQLIPSSGSIAFAICNNENHHTITASSGAFAYPDTLKKVIDGLTVSDQQFDSWRHSLQQEQEKLLRAAKKHPACQFHSSMLHVTDQYHNEVTDYFLAFSTSATSSDQFDMVFHQDVITQVHLNSTNQAYRCFRMNIAKFDELLKHSEQLSIGLTVHPTLGSHHTPVGYRSSLQGDMAAIQMSRHQIQQLFQKNKTSFIHIILRREQTSQTFQIDAV